MWKYIHILLSGTLCLTQDIFQHYHIDAMIGHCIIRVNERCADDDVTFTLYRSDQDVGKIFDVAFPDIGLWFDPLRPTKILIPGYNDVNPNSTLKMIRKEYQNRTEQVNVIHVEWLKLSSPAHCFLSSVLNTPHAGKCLAQMLFALEKNYPEFEPWQAHLIGFSLGATIAAHASRLMREERNVTFRRITGLDPTNPLLNGYGHGPSADLHAGDADFVDVIHTSAGIAGTVDRIGHVDFYVNGGTFQKRCKLDARTGLNQFMFLECSHISAPLFFAESVNSDVGFWGIKCASHYLALLRRCPKFDTQPRELMGDKCSTNAKGVFYVDTNTSPPYARGYH